MRTLQRLAALCLAAALVTLPHGAGAAEPIQIHAIFSLTGPTAFIGKEEASALPIVEAQVNRSGGIAGRPIKFVVQDDESSPQITVQLANALIAQKVPVILGASAVANCYAMAPLVKTDAVMYCASPGFHPEKRSYAFSTGVSTADQFVFLVDYLRRRGLTKIALIASTDVNGQDAEQDLNAALGMPQNKGLSLVMVQHFNPTDLSVDAQIGRIKASGAQALFTFNSGTPFGTILHAVHDLGLDIPILESPAVLNYTTMKQFAEYIPSRLLIFGVPSDAPSVVPNGPVKRAIDAYFENAKRAGVEPDHTVASVYDPALLVVSALRKLGPNATARQIWEYIEGQRAWAGANGVYDFTDGSNRGLTTSGCVVVRYDKATGTFVPVARPGGIPIPQR